MSEDFPPRLSNCRNNTCRWMDSSHPWKEELSRFWDLFTKAFYCLVRVYKNTSLNNSVGGLRLLTCPRCECVCVYRVLWKTRCLQLKPSDARIYCDFDENKVVPKMKGWKRSGQMQSGFELQYVWRKVTCFCATETFYSFLFKYSTFIKR